MPSAIRCKRLSCCPSLSRCHIARRDSKAWPSAADSCRQYQKTKHTYLCRAAAVHAQGELLDMLYQKSLRLGIDVRNARGIGTVVNLQSNDASKVWMMPVHIHTLWNSPFQVSFADTTISCFAIPTWSLIVCFLHPSPHSMHLHAL